jgi:hypothetical protein
LDVEIERHDRSITPRGKLVKALIETRWSPEVAVVLVALRRLCGAVAARGA